jgi:microcystin-dependent protein
MENAYFGEIRIFCGSYAPQYWMFCWGQQLPIANYTSLFSVISNLYGGDGRNNFNLPDMRGLVPIAANSNIPATPPYGIAQKGGQTAYALPDILTHIHLFTGVIADASQTTVTGNYLANSGTRTKKYSVETYTTNTLAAASVGSAGAAGTLPPISNMQPYLPLNFIICTDALYYPPHP